MSSPSTNRHFLPVPENLCAAGVPYLDFFSFIDLSLSPRSYFEIGTHLGRSVKAFKCDAVCVDPQFMLETDVLNRRSQLHFYQMSSDKFFEEHDLSQIMGRRPDICFLDGMHRYEYLLRDFINTEKSCHQRSIVFLHDCLPVNARMAMRTHEVGDPSEGSWAGAWTGDVWKIVPLLRKFRPDLRVQVIDCAPTGLVAITNLDPTSKILNQSYPAIVKEFRDMSLDNYTIQRLWDEEPVLSSRLIVESPEDITLFLEIR